MSLSLEEVKHIADLARLELSGAELAHYREQLSAILSHVAKLQTLDTTGVPPTSGILAAEMSMRADKPRPGLSTEELLKIAPQTDQGQFKIPPVFE